MDTEEATQRYLLAREMDIWQAEAERSRSRIALQQGDSEAAMEQAWYHYCFRKHEHVTWELDEIENPQKHFVGTVPRPESLDDLDRKTG
jgi:hypothetical protein